MFSHPRERRPARRRPAFPGWVSVVCSLNDTCAGWRNGSPIPFLSFIAHLSRALGISLEAPSYASPLGEWRVVFRLWPNSPAYSASLDPRFASDPLRAVAIFISERTIVRYGPLWPAFISARDAFISEVNSAAASAAPPTPSFERVLSSDLAHSVRALIRTGLERRRQPIDSDCLGDSSGGPCPNKQ